MAAQAVLDRHSAFDVWTMDLDERFFWMMEIAVITLADDLGPHNISRCRSDARSWMNNTYTVRVKATLYASIDQQRVR